MKTTNHDQITCPACAKVLDASTNTTGDTAPSPGDITICIGCGAVLTYRDGLRLAAVTDPDVLLDPVVRRAAAIVNMVRMIRDVE